MNKFCKKGYSLSPHFLQNSFISIFNIIQYKKRHGIHYNYWKDFYTFSKKKSINELKQLQNKFLVDFLNFTFKNSDFYKNFYKNIDISNIKNVSDLSMLPIIDKEILRDNFKKIITIPKNKAYIDYTGGTTGKSLEIYFTLKDIKKRWAMLDSFREQFGYKFGIKTAWLSGKNILNPRDENKKRFWKTDFIHNIRYYSTFHLNSDTVKYYLENLNLYKPAIINSFPSSLFELAKISITKNTPITFRPKAIFLTAETLMSEQTKIIEKVFGCKIYNQYSSSEGAPFVNQCTHGNLHYELLSGVIEIVDKNMTPCSEGEILVTSFTTHGTPLIRYRIGDRMKKSNFQCSCGNENPVIEKLDGREIDFIYSKERGKIYSPNISNCVKYAKGIVNFQIHQKDQDKITISIVRDLNSYSKESEKIVLKEFRYRLGDKINIQFDYPDSIPKEKSGKFKLIKNEIKNL